MEGCPGLCSCFFSLMVQPLLNLMFVIGLFRIMLVDSAGIFTFYIQIWPSGIVSFNIQI